MYILENVKNNNDIPNKGFTHAGVFHADEVFTTAFLKILNPEFVWERGFVVPENYDGIVYDIGGGEFDHHFTNARVRDNGVPYAAFGLVWERFGSLIMNIEDADRFDKEFVQMIDQTDNTGVPNPVSSIIRNMNPEWDEELSSDDFFADAVEYAMTTLKSLFKHINAKRRAEIIVKEKLNDVIGNVLFLGEYIPWQSVLKNTPINYVVYKSKRGGYNVQVVTHGVNDEAIYFPVSWRGASPEVLKKLTGIEGLNFCHKGGFLCSTETLDDAENLISIIHNIK